ncbi:MAG: hypothetical protein A3I75_06105 [Deltaproteobacteria bacterium RIFCSPLOWO2_02_FULL_50_16]|nr:MAG: hypothetical protein A3B79_06220 [Deltaproteobacteria bacterium RIFCSPHIGHO2_02_FULL_50_15]OGQ55967.1 MAG: hypothetical protein A3I75_06105 [Deltaproteobacteria bacterium RIFCSPLOWO2_02_FULL_50_16]OGQ66427.1 MAG: hypothetical protein A3F89_02690 [Deltaproteobacteria bacterium RIFCSPLOWO2_12_FULL_50_11]
MANAFDISLLLRFLPLLSQAKGHFLLAGREALLGFDKILEITLEQVSTTSPGPLQTLQPIAHNLKDFIKILLKELPESPETRGPGFEEMKHAVFDAILDVLREEIVLTTTMEDSDKKRHKLEALRAIERVLMRERGDGGEEGAVDEATSMTKMRTTHRVTKLRSIQGRRL